jgi:hypothetical protein
MAQQLAHVPIAAASFAQDAEPRPLEIRKGGKLLACDKIEYCPTPHTAAYDLEAGPVCHGCQPRWCAQLTDKKPSRIKLGGNFRAAEDNAKLQVNPLVAKETLLYPQSQLQTASIRRHTVGEGSWHECSLSKKTNRSGPTPKKPAGNPPPRAYNALARLLRLPGI